MQRNLWLTRARLIPVLLIVVALIVLGGILLFGGEEKFTPFRGVPVPSAPSATP